MLIMFLFNNEIYIRVMVEESYKNVKKNKKVKTKPRCFGSIRYTQPWRDEKFVSSLGSSFHVLV
jgi:hypothetical protein